VSYDIDILVDIPGRDLDDAMKPTSQLRSSTPGRWTSSRWRLAWHRFSPVTRKWTQARRRLTVDQAGLLHLDLTPEGGQVNRPLNPSGRIARPRPAAGVCRLRRDKICSGSTPSASDGSMAGTDDRTRPFTQFSAGG
jgi:hypothetical protein